MASADGVFDLLTGLLRLLGAHLAQVVEFVSDGADWIWTRVDALMEATEIPKDRIRLVLDYYHASKHIGTALEACRDLSAEKRRARHGERTVSLVTSVRKSMAAYNAPVSQGEVSCRHRAASSRGRPAPRLQLRGSSFAAPTPRQSFTQRVHYHRALPVSDGTALV